MAQPLPCEGLLVVDLSQGMAGPNCGMQFAAYGASVIKIEPPEGDWVRRLGKMYGDHSALSLAVNRGKRSIALDLKKPEAVEIVRKLVAKADVLLENNRPGVADRLGLGFKEMSALNPKLVYVSMTGFGQTGPYAQRVSTDTIGQAFSGMMSLTRDDEGKPMKIGFLVIDAVASLYAFQAATMALMQRQKTGRGQHVDASLMDAATALIGYKFIETALEGDNPQPLNVPAGKMSGFADVPDDFLDYLCQLQAYPELDRDALARHYVSRRHYAAYLQLRLRQAQQGSAAQLQLVNDSVSALQPEGDGLRLVLGDGSALRAGAVSVAVGNTLRPLPARGAQLLSRAQRVEAWDYPAVQAIDPGVDVCIVGSGLSMADSVVSLLANGHRGVMHVISRHALLPLPHAEGGAADFDPQPLLAMNLRQRLRGLRQHARQAQAQGLPWQAVMDRIRPLSHALCQSM